MFNEKLPLWAEILSPAGGTRLGKIRQIDGGAIPRKKLGAKFISAADAKAAATNRHRDGPLWRPAGNRSRVHEQRRRQSASACGSMEMIEGRFSRRPRRPSINNRRPAR